MPRHSYVRLTAQGNFKEGTGTLYALYLETNGAAVATADVADSTTTGTPLIAEMASPAAGPCDRRIYPGGIPFNDGLRLEAITGAGAGVVAEFD